MCTTGSFANSILGAVKVPMCMQTLDVQMLCDACLNSFFTTMFLCVVIYDVNISKLDQF